MHNCAYDKTILRKFCHTRIRMHADIKSHDFGSSSIDRIQPGKPYSARFWQKWSVAVGNPHKSKICLARGSLAKLGRGTTQMDHMNGEPLGYTRSRLPDIHTYCRACVCTRVHECNGRKPNGGSPRGQERRRGSQSARSCIAHLTPRFGPHGSMRHVCAFTAKKIIMPYFVAYMRRQLFFKNCEILLLQF